eukprot:g17076.t1
MQVAEKTQEKIRREKAAVAKNGSELTVRMRKFYENNLEWARAREEKLDAQQDELYGSSRGAPQQHLHDTPLGSTAGSASSSVASYLKPKIKVLAKEQDGGRSHQINRPGEKDHKESRASASKEEYCSHGGPPHIIATTRRRSEPEPDGLVHVLFYSQLTATVHTHHALVPRCSGPAGVPRADVSRLIILRNHAWLLQFAALVCLGFFMACFTVTVDLVVGWLFQKRKDLLSTAKLEIQIPGIEDGSGGFVDSRDHDHADRAFLSYYIHSVAQFLQLSPHAFNRAAWVLSCVVLTLTAFALVKANAPFGKGSGLPEVKNLLSCGTKRALSSDAQTLEFLSLETLSWKTVGLMLVLSAGLPIGKLGPYVHISCCATSVACKKLLSSTTSRSGSSGPPSGALQGCVSSWLQANELRIMIAAVAAGVCATFGAPLGAVFFAIEMATTFFFVSHVWRAFCCSVSCLFALRVCGYLHVTRLFALTDLGEPPLEETPWFVLLGVLCGLIARAVISFTKRVFAFAKKLQETGAAVAEVHPGNAGHEMTDSSPSGADGPGRDGGDYRTSSSAGTAGGGRERTNSTFRRTLSRTSCFSSLCSRCRRTFRSVVANWRIVLFVAIVSGVCASLVLVDSRLAVQDKDVINALFSKEPLFSSSSSSSTSNSEDQDQQRRSSESTSLLLLLIAQKSILFPLAAACPVPAGVFTPVFVLGAAVGRVFGEYLEYFVSATEQAKYDSAGGIIFDAGRLFGEAVVPLVGGTGTGTGSPSAVQRIEPALYAVVGATCLTAGVTRMVSVILIVSELTGQVNHLLPMLLAVCAAIITASAAKNSIFDVIIHLRNMRFFPYLRDLRAYHELNARDVCRVVPESCYLNEGFSSGRLLQLAGIYLPAEHVLDEAPLIVPENMSLARIHFLFLMLSLETLLVRLEGADAKGNKVPLGIITRESFFTALETYHRLRG